MHLIITNKPLGEQYVCYNNRKFPKSWHKHCLLHVRAQPPLLRPQQVKSTRSCISLASLKEVVKILLKGAEAVYNLCQNMEGTKKGNIHTAEFRLGWTARASSSSPQNCQYNTTAICSFTCASLKTAVLHAAPGSHGPVDDCFPLSQECNVTLISKAHTRSRVTSIQYGCEHIYL